MFLASDLRVGATGDPGSDFWFSPMAAPTQSGAVVTSDTAFQYSTVYKCVRAYHDSIGSMPRRVMRHDGNKRERVRNHPVARLLSVRPNQWQTPMMFVGMLEAHVQLRGRGYAEIIFDPRTMEPIELIPIHPDRVTTEVMMNGLPRWRVTPPRGQVGPARVLLPGEMFHITGMSMNGYEGVSPVEAMREALGSAIAARDFGSRFWNNDARPPFWIEIPGKFKDNEARSDFRTEWQVSYGGSNRGRPAALDRGMKLHELGLDNQTAEWMKSREYSDIDVCGIWKVPPHKVGILRDAKYANIEMQNIEWVTDSLLPRIVMWEECVHRDLLGYDEDFYLKMIPDQLLRGDIKTRYEAYGKAITDGHMTRNEVRELEDRDPLPGLDEPLQPLNMGNGGRLPAPAPARRERADAILSAAAHRVAKKEAAMVSQLAKGGDLVEAFGKHARFVAEVLALPEAVALGYCDAARIKVEEMQAAGTLGGVTVEQWTETQAAALVRLGD
jgi:HK97 family phage portal protein